MPSLPTRLLFPVLLATLPLMSQTTSQPAPTNNLLPHPTTLTPAPGTFPLTSSLTVAITGARTPRLDAAVLRTLKRLEDATGLPLPRSLDPAPTTASLNLHVAADTPIPQSIDEDESYTLTITPTAITIDSPTTTGALHALETLVQLPQPAGPAYVLPALTIADKPRFRWRGLMIDCSRHFEPIDVLKRNLDAMAAVKLNVFHWHLTDDQGFRIESKHFPKLTALGSDGLFYTQEQARDLVRYARDRGIRVVPEFEMPGHSTAWLVAHPELASGTTPTGIRREFGISEVALDPTRDATYKFLDTFLTEMVTIFPDQYVHIGGDETPAPDWKTNPRILAFKRAHQLADNDALQAYFNSRINTILTRLHKRMLGWDEIFNQALPKDIAIQSWRGEASLVEAAKAGYAGVLSAPYYLDAMKPAGVHYLADPVPVSTALTPAQQRLILGGEICMWAEQLDRRSLESRLWPRSAAIAERLWSPQTVTNVDSLYQRLEPVSRELESLGLEHVAHTDAALRDLAGTDDIAALRTLAAATEPVSFSDRYRGQHTSQLTPLTGFVDAVRPDPPSRYRLEHAAKVFLADPHSASPATIAAQRELNSFFQNLGIAVPELRRQATASPRLATIMPRLDQIPPLTLAGIEAVLYLGSNTRAPAGWHTKNLALLEAARKPTALVRFTFLDPLAQLITATPEAAK